jgi:hypothetical protein
MSTTKTRTETREADTSFEADRIQVEAFAKGAIKVATERDAPKHWTIVITWRVEN